MKFQPTHVNIGEKSFGGLVVVCQYVLLPKFYILIIVTELYSYDNIINIPIHKRLANIKKVLLNKSDTGTTLLHVIQIIIGTHALTELMEL